MEYSLHRVKIYKIKGILLSKSKYLHEQILSQNYTINGNSFIGETHITTDIDTDNDIYYTKIVLGNSILVGFNNSGKDSDLSEILEQNKTIQKEQNTPIPDQLYLVCKATSKQKFNKIDLIKKIGNYYYTIQGWPNITNPFKAESESIINTIVAFTNATIMNKYIHPALEVLNDFSYFKTNQNDIIFDFYLSGSAHALLSRPYDGRKLRVVKKLAKNISTDLKELHKIDQLYVKMMEEADPLKKFLFGYYCIEVIINKSYGSDVSLSRIDQKLSKISGIKIKSRLTSFLSNDLNHNIRDKFIINSSLIWDGINDVHYNDFIEIKKIRDKISHGSFSVSKNLPIDKVESILSILLENYHATTI